MDVGRIRVIYAMLCVDLVWVCGFIGGNVVCVSREGLVRLGHQPSRLLDTTANITIDRTLRKLCEFGFLVPMYGSTGSVIQV